MLKNVLKSIKTFKNRKDEKIPVNNSEVNFNKEKYLKHLSNDVFTVKYKERSSGRVVEINPNINDPFYDNLYRNAFQTGEYILISGVLPDKWK
jgi:predicted peptidase